MLLAASSVLYDIIRVGWVGVQYGTVPCSGANSLLKMLGTTAALFNNSL